VKKSVLCSFCEKTPGSFGKGKKVNLVLVIEKKAEGKGVILLKERETRCSPRQLQSQVRFRCWSSTKSYREGPNAKKTGKKARKERQIFPTIICCRKTKGGAQNVGLQIKGGGGEPTMAADKRDSTQKRTPTKQRIN